MKRRLMSVISILAVALLAGCGPAATPTMSVADAQATAMADAWLALTQTQAAIPPATETPIPATPTVTSTPLPLIPTIPPPPAFTDTPEVDACDLPAPLEPIGTTVKVKFVNKTDSTLNLSFAMIQANAENECGIYSYSLSRYDEPVVDVLAGCYQAWAWIDASGNIPSSNAQSLQALCVTDPGKTTSIWITAEVINFH